MTFDEMRDEVEEVIVETPVTRLMRIQALAAISQAESLAKIERHLSILAASIDPASLFVHSSLSDIRLEGTQLEELDHDEYADYPKPN